MARDIIMDTETKKIAIGCDAEAPSEGSFCGVTKGENMTVGEMSDGWISCNVRGFVRESSLANYYNNLSHIKRHLGRCRAGNVDKQAVQRFVSELLNDVGLAPITVRGIIITLSSVFKCMVEDGILAKNPCIKLKLPEIIEKEIKVFTKHEQERLERSILSGKDYRELGVLICLYTGLRLGELCALKWDCINFKTRMMQVRASVGRVKDFSLNAKAKTRIAEGEPKTKKSKRWIPLPHFLCDILKQLKARTQSEYVLPSKADNTTPLQPRTMQHVYRRLMCRAKLSYVNFHTLRHTFATRSVELGSDIKSLSEMLGHSNVLITMNRYAHSLLEQKQRAMAFMNAFWQKKRTRIESIRAIF